MFGATGWTARVSMAGTSPGGHQVGNHAATTFVSLSLDFAPELGSVVTALTPALLQVVAELSYACGTTMRGGSFWKMTGSQKTSDGLSL